jgi:hypothetical protein
MYTVRRKCIQNSSEQRFSLLNDEALIRHWYVRICGKFDRNIFNRASSQFRQFFQTFNLNTENKNNDI